MQTATVPATNPAPAPALPYPWLTSAPPSPTAQDHAAQDDTQDVAEIAAATAPMSPPLRARKDDQREAREYLRRQQAAAGRDDAAELLHQFVQALHDESINDVARAMRAAAEADLAGDATGRDRWLAAALHIARIVALADEAEEHMEADAAEVA